MSPGAVTARLREMARLLEERGAVSKGVDMSAAAISGRLRLMGALSDMCRRLGAAGAGLRPLGPDVPGEGSGRVT
jgi:hypothetical protein